MFIEDDSHDFAAWVLHRLMSREGGEGGAREGVEGVPRPRDSVR